MHTFRVLKVAPKVLPEGRLKPFCFREGRFGPKVWILEGRPVFLEFYVDPAPAAIPAAIPTPSSTPSSIPGPTSAPIPIRTSSKSKTSSYRYRHLKLRPEHNLLRFGFYTREGVYEYIYIYNNYKNI